MSKKTEKTRRVASRAQKNGPSYQDFMMERFGSAGVPMGLPSSDDVAGIFPSFAVPKDFAAHWYSTPTSDGGFVAGCASRVFPSPESATQTTMNAKREAVNGTRLMAELMLAIADESLPRRDLANLAYGVGLLAGRLEARLNENHLLRAVRVGSGSVEGGKARRKVDPKQLFDAVQQAMAGNCRSLTDVTNTVGPKFGMTGAGVRKSLRENFPAEYPKLKIRKF